MKIEALGANYAQHWSDSIPHWDACPGKINIKIILWLRTLVLSYGMVEYAQDRYRGLATSGGQSTWYPGARAEEALTLRSEIVEACKGNQWGEPAARDDDDDDDDDDDEDGTALSYIILLSPGPFSHSCPSGFSSAEHHCCCTQRVKYLISWWKWMRYWARRPSLRLRVHQQLPHKVRCWRKQCKLYELYDMIGVLIVHS